MVDLLVRCLALFFCLQAVASQGGVLGLKTTTSTTPTSQGGVLGRKTTTSTTPGPVTAATTTTTTVTTTTNTSIVFHEEGEEVGDRINRSNSSLSNEVTQRTYEVASDAVYSVATRLHHLVDPTGTKNYLVSPLSVALLAGQLLLAARGDAERRLRALLTSLRPPLGNPRAGTTVFERQQNADLELHTQLGGLLKDLQSQGQGNDATYQLAAASVFFLNHDLKLKNSFTVDITKLYGSELVRLNFSGDPGSSLTTMNEWASNNTYGRIQTIFSEPLPRFTAVVLVNSVYFRSEWETPFDPDLTAPGVFRLNDTHQIRVQNMRGQFDLDFVDHADLHCRMIVLPYKSPDVNMYVILPHKEVTDMKDFALKLTTANMTTLIKATSPYSVTVVLPKMALKAKYSLKDPIMKYKPQPQPQQKNNRPNGIFTRLTRRNKTSTTTTSKPTAKTTTARTTTTQLPSRPYLPAQTKPPKPSGGRPGGNRPINNNPNKPWFDLSGASLDDRFRINDIVHQISLEVSEKGTEAAAITSGSIDYSLDGKVFKVDRPFMFFIRHEPSLVNLFYGVIMDPTNGNYD